MSEATKLPGIELKRIACAHFPSGVCWTANLPYCSPEQHFRTKPQAAWAAVKAKRALMGLSEHHPDKLANDSVQQLNSPKEG